MGSSFSQATAPVPAGPTGAFAGAATLSSFLAKMAFLTDVSMNAGVPSAVKRWLPSLGRVRNCAGSSKQVEPALGGGVLTARPGMLLKRAMLVEAMEVPS